MRRPIDRQIKSILEDLRELKAYMTKRQPWQDSSPTLVVEKKRKRTECYSSYLQVLDANDTGDFTDNEISKYVRPELIADDDPLLGGKTIYRYRRVAMHLRDKGYRDIAARDSTSA
jgi:hypothetical protein